ncbi:lysine 2,3-aminomutase [bacterium]|nr:lysine 2,3-aminomutase [bacterium]
MFSESCKVYNLHNWRTIPQIKNLSAEDIESVETAARVFPFKVNAYVSEHLIDWANGAEDPLFRMLFPHRDMLCEDDFAALKELIRRGSDSEIANKVLEIRRRLNPNPADQLSNVPLFRGKTLTGIQHKYRETVLIFPTEGQSCFAWCTFCFRWPQFCRTDVMRFSGSSGEDVCAYLQEHKEVSDVLLSGGDPLTMAPERLSRYLQALLSPGLEHVRNIRVGSKALSWYPQLILQESFVPVLRAFEGISAAGRSITFAANLCHPRELQNADFQNALRRVQRSGAVVRAQGPLLRGVNDSAEALAELWREEVRWGIVPYYLFAARDTGARTAFQLPLLRAWEIYRSAYASVSGLCRSARGPVMSCTPGKVQILGPGSFNGSKALSLIFLQCRRPELVGRPFFAEYDERALWWDQLRPLTEADREFFC